MKWLQHPLDSLINYTADRFYERLKGRVLKDLEPYLEPVVSDAIDMGNRTLSDLFKWLP